MFLVWTFARDLTGSQMFWGASFAAITVASTIALMIWRDRRETERIDRISLEEAWVAFNEAITVLDDHSIERGREAYVNGWTDVLWQLVAISKMPKPEVVNIPSPLPTPRDDETARFNQWWVDSAKER